MSARPYVRPVGSGTLGRGRRGPDLAHLAAHGPAPALNTRLGYLTSLRGFLETTCRRGWLELPVDAAIYHYYLPKRPAALPRFVPEDLMARLESDEALAYLPDSSTRRLVVVLIETGLRAGDAPAGWPSTASSPTASAGRAFAS